MARMHHFGDRLHELERMKTVVREDEQRLSRAKKLPPEEKERLTVTLRGNKQRLLQMQGAVDAESASLVQRNSFTISDLAGLAAVTYLTRTHKWDGSVSLVDPKKGVKKFIEKALAEHCLYSKRNRNKA